MKEVRRLKDALKGAAVITNQAQQEKERLTKEIEKLKEDKEMYANLFIEQQLGKRREL